MSSTSKNTSLASLFPTNNKIRLDLGPHGFIFAVRTTIGWAASKFLKMKHFLASFLAVSMLAFTVKAGTQLSSTACHEIYLTKVLAPSGLVLREKPGRGSNKLAVVPNGGEVTICINHEVELVQEQMEDGLAGIWQKAQYKGLEGYLFDAYLDKKHVVEVFMAHYELNETLPRPVVGVYPANKEAAPSIYLTDLRLRKVKVKEEIRTNGEKITFVDKPRHAAEPYFYIAGLPLKDSVQSGFCNIYDEFSNLYPGSSKEFYISSYKTKYRVFATGEAFYEPNSTKLDHEGHKVDHFVRNYKVYLQQQSEQGIETQILYEADELYTDEGHLMGGAKLVYLGDLDGDGGMDLMLRFPDYYGERTMLFLSSRAEKGQLLKLVRSMSTTCC